MLNCKSLVDQASDFTDKSLPWHRVLSIKFHLLMCVHCRRFMRHFRTTINLSAHIAKENEQLSDTEVSEVMDSIKQLDSGQK